MALNKRKAQKKSILIARKMRVARFPGAVSGLLKADMRCHMMDRGGAEAPPPTLFSTAQCQFETVISTFSFNNTPYINSHTPGDTRIHLGE